jgi:hypothetical protein
MGQEDKLLVTVLNHSRRRNVVLTKAIYIPALSLFNLGMNLNISNSPLSLPLNHFVSTQTYV